MVHGWSTLESYRVVEINVVGIELCSDSVLCSEA